MVKAGLRIRVRLFPLEALPESFEVLVVPPELAEAATALDTGARLIVTTRAAIWRTRRRDIAYRPADVRRSSPSVTAAIATATATGSGVSLSCAPMPITAPAPKNPTAGDMAIAEALLTRCVSAAATATRTTRLIACAQASLRAGPQALGTRRERRASDR